VLPQPQLSKPVQYHSVNSPNYFCGERGTRTPVPVTVNCFQDSSLDQPDSLHCVSGWIRTISVFWTTDLQSATTLHLCRTHNLRKQNDSNIHMMANNQLFLPLNYIPVVVPVRFELTTLRLKAGYIYPVELRDYLWWLIDSNYHPPRRNQRNSRL
jgi:hypothetical protein